MILLHELTEVQLLEMIRNVVREEMKARFDKAMTKKEVATLYGVSESTVYNMMKRGDIHRINSPPGHPLFSYNEIINLKKNHKL